MKKRIVLASKSPRRKKMLEDAGIKYECVAPVLPEVGDKKRPSAIVKDLAYKKAIEVVEKLDKKAVVIAADTMVVCDGEVIGKPKSCEDGERILKKLCFNLHYVYTGIVVIDMYEDKVYKDYERTTIKMKRISDELIKELSSKHLDKAGSYAIQEDGDELVEKIKGDYHNVVGLPLKKLLKILKEC